MPPKNQDNKPVQINNQLQITEHFSGPLPHPKILEHYDRIVPGAADRIIKKFESQTEHRQFLENKVINGDNFRATLGLIFGFIIAMSAIFGGIYTALQGYQWLGGSLSFAGLALLVGAFVKNRHQKENNE
ncbi:MAG: DUF2335 domain-containing protein [Patescibacteria group bacterium]